MEKIIIKSNGNELKIGELHTEKIYVFCSEVGTATADDGKEIALLHNAVI